MDTKTEKSNDLQIKWTPILEACRIPKEYCLNVAYYAENISKMETIDIIYAAPPGEYEPDSIKQESLLSLGIKIISEIDDLSKVYFMNAPRQDILGETISVGSIRYTFPLSISDVQYLEILNVSSKDKASFFEHRIKDKIVKSINTEILNGKFVYIWNICASIKILKQENGLPIIEVISRFTTKQFKNMKDIKRIDIKEFREKGYLQEINRNFLHLLGLALEIIIDDDGNEVLGGIWDYRDDQEGIYYDIKNSDEERINRFKNNRDFIDNELNNRLKTRKKELGFDIEPI